MPEDRSDQSVKPYQNRAFLAAETLHLAKIRRLVPPTPRDGAGRYVRGSCGNPHGRPPGRPSMRVAFHRFGLDAAAKLAALIDDPHLSAVERAEVLSQCLQLSCSIRVIRSDARAQKKLKQIQRDQELHAAMMAVLRRAETAAAQREMRTVLREAGIEEQQPDPDPDWLR